MRRPRRKPVMDKPELTSAVAVEYERDGWPSVKERREFWSGDDVPDGLRDRDEPDPRVVLTGDVETARTYRDQVDAWRRQRGEWLAAAAGAA